MLYQVIHLKDHFPFLGENGKDPTLTVYAADNMYEMKWDDKKHPSALICPGGSYVYTSFREAEPIALNLLPMGYNAFVLDYSCAPHCFPTQLIEVAAALELMHANADIWHVDTQRIAIMGFSAGGHLAASLLTHYTDTKTRPDFGVLVYPVISMDDEITHKGSCLNLLGDNPTPEQRHYWSAEKQVTADTPPCLIVTCQDDPTVQIANSMRFYEALTAHKVPSSLVIVPVGKHGWGFSRQFPDREIIDQAIISFMAQYT